VHVTARAACFALLVAGCAREALSTDGGADLASSTGGDLASATGDLATTAGDFGTTGADLSTAGDDGGATGVVCGGALCSLACCTPDHGVSGMCVDPAATSCTEVYRCDGPEDCAGQGGVCCETQFGASSCGDPSFCIRNSITWVMCHADGDCPMFAPACCPIVQGSPWLHCQSKC
jgi:hypothetical protein